MVKHLLVMDLKAAEADGIEAMIFFGGNKNFCQIIITGGAAVCGVLYKLDGNARYFDDAKHAENLLKKLGVTKIGTDSND